MKRDEGGYAAVDWKAPRRCVYCAKRQATPDSLSCVECMRGVPVPLDPAGMQNARWVSREELATIYPPLTRWQRFTRWLRRLT